MRLIDAHLAQEIADRELTVRDAGNVQFVLSHTPTIDAEPVVRCGECKYWKPSDSEAGNTFADMEPIGGCRYVNYCRRASDFCSYGERRANDE